jgi:cytidylate kinase
VTARREGAVTTGGGDVGGADAGQRGSGANAVPSAAASGVPTVQELTRVVALDGPAGTGKSTVSRLVAQALGWRFVDTGATYRAVTLAVLRAGADPEDPQAAAAAARGADVRLVTDPQAPTVLLDGEDVSADVRTPQVTAQVSAVSSVPAVREVLIEIQRRAMGVDGSVVEGRDIATVVAPLAAVKVFLDARPEVRAARRAGDADAGVVLVPATPTQSGHAALTAVEADLARRDERDSQTNPLVPSGGAVHLDTSDLSLDQVVAAIVQLVRDAGMTP